MRNVFLQYKNIKCAYHKIQNSWLLLLQFSIGYKHNSSKKIQNKFLEVFQSS